MQSDTTVSRTSRHSVKVTLPSASPLVFPLPGPGKATVACGPWIHFQSLYGLAALTLFSLSLSERYITSNLYYISQRLTDCL